MKKECYTTVLISNQKMTSLKSKLKKITDIETLYLPLSGIFAFLDYLVKFPVSVVGETSAAIALAYEAYKKFKKEKTPGIGFLLGGVGLGVSGIEKIVRCIHEKSIAEGIWGISELIMGSALLTRYISRQTTIKPKTGFNLYYPNLFVSAEGKRTSLLRGISKKAYIKSLKQVRPYNAHTFREKHPENLLKNNKELSGLVKHLVKNCSSGNNLEKTYLIMDLVAAIPLDTTQNKGFVKSPLETLVENNGDQTDLVVLGSLLLNEAGVNSVIFDYDGYAVLGVSLDEDGINFPLEKDREQVIEYKGNHYLLLDLPHFKIGNTFSPDQQIVKRELKIDVFRAESLFYWSYYPQKRQWTTAVLTKKGNVVANGKETQIPVDTSYDKFFLNYIYNMDRDYEEGKFSFLYNISNEDYLTAAAIERTETFDLSKDGFIKLMDFSNPFIARITDHLFNEILGHTDYNDTFEYYRAQLILDFGLKIPYLKEKGDYPKNSIETLAEFSGDCEDQAILVASMMKYAKLDVVLFDFPNHFSVGVYIPDSQVDNLEQQPTWFEYNGKKYYVCEAIGMDLPESPNRHLIGYCFREYAENPALLQKIIPVCN